jgi:nitrite reductase (cytochrome c-552)
MKKHSLWPLLLIAAGGLLLPGGFSAPAAAAEIPEGTIDPAVWGQVHPLYYGQWQKTKEPTPPGKSRYRKGWDADNITWDRLSQYPYLALLFNGWGFGVEYNEPRGHAYMVIDQVEIDPSRIGAGGVCLTCKTPYAPKLEKELGQTYYRDGYMEVRSRIPQEHQDLGVACVDCHNASDMSLTITRDFTLGRALQAMGTDPAQVSRQEMRSLVCAQCHVTYNIPKDDEKKSIGIYFPWQKSKLGNITIEDIIAQFRTDPTIAEWTQTVTGFRLPFIRHPEYELFSNNSIHWQAGVSCADCHMPLVKADATEIADHRVTSPLKTDLHACGQCHEQETEWLRQRVYDIQDRVASMQIRSGYGTATVAKLFEMVHAAQKEGKSIDPQLYDQAKDYYIDAFFRTIFIGAENSVGFHNPPEAARVLSDAVAFAGKAEGLLRQALAQAGVTVPVKVDLELAKYIEARGKTKVPFRPEQEVKDPFGIQERFQ